MQVPAISQSYTLQHQGTFSDNEINELTKLFQELVSANQELLQLEEKRGPDRDLVVATESQKSLDELIVDKKINQASSETINSLHHQENCDALDKSFNVARQKFLHTTFKVIEHLRSLNEYFAWECDLTDVIKAMTFVCNYFKSMIDIHRNPDYEKMCRHQEEEIEQHKDQSSELFLRTAYGQVVMIKEDEIVDNPVTGDQLLTKVVHKCVKTFEAFRKNLVELSKKKKVFPEGYETFVLSLKAFGLAFKNYKSVATSFTVVNCFQPFAALQGYTVAVKIPDIEI
jgi:hypothetical protein